VTSLEEKLARYAKPSSNNEKEKQDRAECMVRNAVKQWANEQNVSVKYLPKGSYANNTNVRLDSDVEIAVIYKGFHYFDDSTLRPEHRHSKRSAKGNYRNCSGPFRAVSGAAG
jgi:tRNA nucleotidyltransferase (CCA-adding enzyme)